MAILTPVDVEPIYNLALSLDELNFLYTILHFIGGNVSYTDRKYGDSILDSITIMRNSLKYEGINLHLSYNRNKVSGGIIFDE